MTRSIQYLSYFVKFWAARFAIKETLWVLDVTLHLSEIFSYADLVSGLLTILMLREFAHHVETCNKTAEFHFGICVFVIILRDVLFHYSEYTYIISNVLINIAAAFLSLWFARIPKKKLPLSASTSKYTDNVAEQTCGICLENGCDYIAPSCEHIYHHKCIEEWVTQKDGNCCYCFKEIKAV